MHRKHREINISEKWRGGDFGAFQFMLADGAEHFFLRRLNTKIDIKIMLLFLLTTNHMLLFFFFSPEKVSYVKVKVE